MDTNTLHSLQISCSGRSLSRTMKLKSRAIPGTMPNLTMQISAIFHFFVLVLLEFPQSRGLPVSCFIITLTDLQQAFALITKFKTAGQFIAPESVRTFYRPLRAIRAEVPNISRVVESEFHSVSPGCIPSPTDFWRTGVSVSWKNIATGKQRKNSIVTRLRVRPGGFRHQTGKGAVARAVG